MNEQDQTASQTSELDKLLSEAEAPAIKALGAKIDAVAEQQKKIADNQEADREEKTQEGIAEALGALKEKIPEPLKKLPVFSDTALEVYLDQQAKGDEALMNAFTGRFKDPATWQTAKTALAEKFGKDFEDLPDTKLTEDREAALASAANQTKSAETDFDEKAVGTMPTSDFNDLQRSLGVPPYGSS